MLKVGKATICGSVIVFVMALVLAACGGGDSTSGNTPTSDGSGEDVRVGLVAETSGFNDRSFNSLSLKGLKQAESELGIEGRAVSSAAVSDYVPNLTSLAREGFSPVIAVGFEMAEPVATVAKSFPDTTFAIVDVSQAEIEGKPKNVLGLVFNQAEASYLAGYLSAEFVEEPGAQFGMIGGLSIPPVQSWMSGYSEGVKHANPKAGVLSAFSQTFADQAPCKQLAERQIAENTKVIFQIAGGCGLGVYAAARTEPGVWYIGVDADQSFLGDHVLTSAIKKVDVAVFDVAKEAQEGTLKAGTDLTFDLANDGVGLGPVSSEVPQDVLDKVDQVEQQILDGQITPVK